MSKDEGVVNSPETPEDAPSYDVSEAENEEPKSSPLDDISAILKDIKDEE